MIPKDSPPVLGATYTPTDAMKFAFSSSEILPKNVNRLRNEGSTSLRNASESPGPATSTRTSGSLGIISGRAATIISSPLRGSSKRPMKPMVFPVHLESITA